MFRTLQRWLGKPQNRSTRATLRVEGLDARITPSTSIGRWGSTVVINGDHGNDNVLVSNDGLTVTVDLNGQTKSFDAAKVRGIVFRGWNGDDNFTNNTDVRAAVNGGNGNDSLTGGGGNDVLLGGLGDDTLLGGGGRDRLSGYGGDDDLDGDLGDDSLFGGSGRDDLSGGDGDDDLRGEVGDDSLLGGDGDDSINGGGGNDSLDGAAGSDRIHSGGGHDSSMFDSDDLCDDSREHHGARTAGQFAEVEGTISAIDGNNVTIRTRSGATVTVVVTDSTSLEVNGAHVALSAFSVGMPAESRFDPTTFAAFDLESGEDEDQGDNDGDGQDQGTEFEGTVTAVGDNSVTLRSRGGAELTVTIDAATKIERNDQHVALSAILVSDFGEVLYDPTTLVATKVESVG